MKSHEQSLKLLIQFAGADLAELRRGDRLNLQEDLAALIEHAIDPEKLPILQARVREIFGEAQQVSRKRFPVTLRPKIIAGPRLIFDGTTLDVFTLTVFRLLAVTGAERVKPCQECGTIFYREVFKQRHCSRLCAQRVYMRNYRVKELRTP